MEEKHLNIIAGPNGAGKTTASYIVFNSVTPHSIIATGGCDQKTMINDEVKFKIIAAYVKH